MMVERVTPSCRIPERVGRQDKLGESRTAADPTAEARCFGDWDLSTFLAAEAAGKMKEDPNQRSADVPVAGGRDRKSAETETDQGTVAHVDTKETLRGWIALLRKIQK